MRKTTASILMLLVWPLAACSTTSGEASPDGMPSTHASAKPGASEPEPEDPGPKDVAPRAVADAQDLKEHLDPKINHLRNTFGEGTNSPCSSASPKLFTSDCAQAVEETAGVARAAVKQIEGAGKYATLRLVADKILDAERGYSAARCSVGPSDPSVRAQCLGHSAVIAQAPVDLHQGVVAGLAGN
ncbi:hypothetical protein ACFV2V_31025 [Streptomyces sp. NPDC059698]|uniref:hypothetical protein n=1 Tax=unclassified Streptomyces TaxID=2593676 RepID=UPI00116144DE|nr:hypothetical protein [Streptomyces sp. CB02366]